MHSIGYDACLTMLHESRDCHSMQAKEVLLTDLIPLACYSGIAEAERPSSTF